MSRSTGKYSSVPPQDVAHGQGLGSLRSVTQERQDLFRRGMEKLKSGSYKNASTTFSSVFPANHPTNALLSADARMLQDMEGLPGSGACLLVNKDDHLKQVSGDPEITLPMFTGMTAAAEKAWDLSQGMAIGITPKTHELTEKQKKTMEMANKWAKAADNIVKDTVTLTHKQTVKTLSEQAVEQTKKRSYLWVVALGAVAFGIYAYNAFSS